MAWQKNIKHQECSGGKRNTESQIDGNGQKLTKNPSKMKAILDAHVSGDSWGGQAEKHSQGNTWENNALRERRGFVIVFRTQGSGRNRLKHRSATRAARDGGALLPGNPKLQARPHMIVRVSSGVW